MHCQPGSLLFILQSVITCLSFLSQSRSRASSEVAIRRWGDAGQFLSVLFCFPFPHLNFLYRQASKSIPPCLAISLGRDVWVLEEKVVS